MTNFNHNHKCSDCGIEFKCPCGKYCGIDYDKHPCRKCFNKHFIITHSTIEEANNDKL